MKLNTVALLDRYYASELGCDSEMLNNGQLHVVEYELVREIRFAKGTPLALFSIGKKTGTVISVIPCLKETVSQSIIGKTTLDDTTCDVVESSLAPLVRARMWFRGCRLYCDQASFIDFRAGEVRDVTEDDEMASLIHEKWGGRVFGRITDGKVVSWAGVKPLSELAWDISIQTLPEYRGLGCAKSVACAAVRHIFDHGKIATWGTDRTNIASICTAHSVGFQDYGLDFGCVADADCNPFICR
ncbi:MAG: GNAT family N-acetyltransferase [Armatimonadota bacterium]|nr:GNAT family N-acetyltransferase [bacterium]